MQFMIASEHIEKFQSLFILSRRLRLVKKTKQQQTAIRTIYGAMYYIYYLSETNEIKWRLQTSRLDSDSKYSTTFFYELQYCFNDSIYSTSWKFNYVSVVGEIEFIRYFFS